MERSEGQQRKQVRVRERAKRVRKVPWTGSRVKRGKSQMADAGGAMDRQQE